MEHQIIFSYDEKDKDFYCHIHLVNKSFWDRVKYAVKYIFGHKCRYGAFDEFVFNPDDADKLQEIVNKLKE